MVNAAGLLERRDLIALDKRVLEPKQGELTARTIFGVNTDTPAGAEAYGYDVITRTGSAKILANGADDFPLVDVDAKRTTQPIVSFGDGVTFTNQEKRQYAMTGKPIPTLKAETARRALAEFENQLFYKGDESTGVKGLLNADGIQVVTNETPFSELITDTSAEAAVRLIGKLRSKITTIKGYSNVPLALLLPSSVYEELSIARYNTYESRTALEVIQGRTWFSKIKVVDDLEGAGDAGTDSLVITAFSDDVVEMILPMDATQLPVEQTATKEKVYWEERSGGAAVRIPYLVLRVDNV